MSPMIKTFTPNDVVRYFYNETSNQENLEIEQALIIDSELMELYKELKSSVELLDSIQIKPSDRVVDKILAYSKSKNINSLCE